uniref:Membrane protein n=1 Tax=Transmissible gastroenteritis virus TaxID=11149 RepID=Q6PQ04_TGEV|nr:membrane protein [Transmissible gastroenteritis virus]
MKILLILACVIACACGERYCAMKDDTGLACRNSTASDCESCFNGGDLIWHLANWNFSWSIILIIFITVLQYGRPQFSWFVYGIKMLIMWLLWPIVLALTIFNAYSEYQVSRYVMFGFSIAGAIVTFVLWIMYFVRSIQLYRRTKSWWSFNPETNAILCVSALGRSYVLPLEGVPTGVTLTLLSGNLYAEGFKIAGGMNIDNLPKYVMVALPSRTIVYTLVGKKLKASSATGWAYYVKSKAGDYSTEARTDNLSEQEKLLHLV